MKKSLILFVCLVVPVLSYSQTNNSFMGAEIIGISSTNLGTTLTVLVSDTATMIYQGETYGILAVRGVWSLDDNSDMIASGLSQNGWAYHANFHANEGRTAGWHSVTESGLANNVNHTFHYQNMSGTVEGIGYQLVLDRTVVGMNTNSGYFRHAPVPEPGTLFIVGGLSLLGLRRKMKS